MSGLLLIDERLLQEDPTTPQLLERLRLRGVPHLALAAAPVHHRPLLQALAHQQAAPAQTWIVTTHPAWVLPATTAGLAGVVLIGTPPPAGDHSIVVAQADHVADCPRVMVPRQGGCWHDPR